MAQKFTVPITVKQLTSASSDAVTVYVDADTYARLKVEAGGRLVWGSGALAGDVNLYRDSADVLRTDDTFKTPVLFVDNIEIDTTGATTNQVLKFDGTKFIAATAPSGATNLDGLTDVAITTPEQYQTVVYDGTQWINEFPTTVSYVNNAEATTLQVGEAVYLYGNVGNRASVKRASNASDTTSAKTMGLVATAIPAGGNGPVVTRGYVTGMDLSVGYTAGQTLYLGTGGGYTTTKPYAPSHLVYIGVVVRATNNGIIYVAAQNGYELDEIHDVDLITTAPTAGDFLKYNGTLWVNDKIDLGTDTVGNYMSDISAGTGISVTHTPSEGSTGTVAIDTAVVPRLGVTNTFSTNQIISGSTTADLLRITQTGTGNALVVEDSTNPDSTPFVVDASGNVLIGGTSTTGSSLLEIFNDGSLGQTIRGAGAAGGRLLLQRANGTMSSPTAVTAANVTGQIRSDGYDGTNYTNSSAINFSVDSTVSTGVVPGRIGFFTASSAGTLTERMRINSAGEVGIGVSPSTSITLRVMKNITGAINAYGIVSQGVIQPDVTNAGYAFYSGVGTAASATVSNVIHYIAVQGTFDATSTVTTQSGFHVSSGMTGATTNYGFRGALAASGASRWNLNMDGTAPNYLAGRLGVGTAITSGAMAQITNTTAADKAFVVKGATSQTGYLTDWQNSAGTSLAYVDSSGNAKFASIDGGSA